MNAPNQTGRLLVAIAIAISVTVAVTRPSEVTIEGSLIERPYPGRANFESVEKGDEPKRMQSWFPIGLFAVETTRGPTRTAKISPPARFVFSGRYPSEAGSGVERSLR